MKYLIAALACASIAFAPVAQAHHSDSDDSTDDPGNSKTDEVCGAFNLGVPRSDLPGMLHANDGRENYWQGWKDSTWPIIEGQCDVNSP
jgi:hypothetical protein